MTIHECPRCGYETKISGDMKKHLVRKTICKATKDNISLDEFKKTYFKIKVYTHYCDNCHKGFISKRGQIIHMTNCKVLNVPLITNNEIVLHKQNEELNNNRIERMENMIVQMFELLKSNNINTTTIINQDITNNNKILNININAVGYEQILHIINDIPFMKSCLMNDVKGLIQYIYDFFLVFFMFLILKRKNIFYV